MSASTPKRRCRVEGCTRTPLLKRNICGCCRRRQQRAADPIRDHYSRIKASAKRRGYAFTITLEWFIELCERTRYHELAGQRPGDLTLDRVDNNRGYEPDNLRVITHNANTVKGNIERHVSGARAQWIVRALCSDVAPYTPPDLSTQWW